MTKGLGVMAEPLKQVSYIISGYMRIQATCSSISSIYCTILKESKATSIPNYEGIKMLENRIREQMSEYSRVFNIEFAYISLKLSKSGCV